MFLLEFSLLFLNSPHRWIRFELGTLNYELLLIHRGAKTPNWSFCSSADLEITCSSKVFPPRIALKCQLLYNNKYQMLNDPNFLKWSEFAHKLQSLCGRQENSALHIQTLGKSTLIQARNTSCENQTRFLVHLFLHHVPTRDTPGLNHFCDGWS